MNTTTKNNYNYKKSPNIISLNGNITTRNRYDNYIKNKNDYESQNNSNVFHTEDVHIEDNYDVKEIKKEFNSSKVLNTGKPMRLSNHMLARIGDTTFDINSLTVRQGAGQTGRNIRQVYVISKTALDLSLGTVMNTSTRYQNRKRISEFKQELVKRERKTILEKGGTEENVRNVSKITLKKKFDVIEKEELKKINTVLRKNGLNPLNAKGRELQKIANNNLRKSKYNQYSKEVIEALKNAKNLGRVGLYNTLPKALSVQNINMQVRKVSNLVMIQFARYGGETGQGLYTIYGISNKAKILVKSSLKIVHKIARAGRTVFKQAVLRNNLSVINKLNKEKKRLSQLKATKKDTTKSQKRINRLKEKQTKLREKRNEKRNNVIKKNIKKEKKRKRNEKRIKNIGFKIKNKVSNTFIGRNFIKIKNSKFGKFVDAGTKAGRKLASGVLGIITKPFAILKRALDTLKKYLLIGIGGIVVMYFALVAIFAALSAICSVFDLSGASNKEIVTDYLQTLYINDLKYMVYFHEGFYINFEDIRTQEKYNEYAVENNNNKDDKENEKTEATNIEYWTQSTNGAEILTMAYVYYDYGFEDEDVEDIKNYVEGLYYGSHQIITDETLGCCTFKTIYFDQLFTVETRKGILIDPNTYGSYDWYDGFANDDMYHSPETIIENNVGQLSENEKLVYDTLISLGYSDMAACAIMGNIYGESNFDPTIDNGVALGLFQFDYAAGTADAYKTWCDTNSDGNYYTIENQCAYFNENLGGNFTSYTGCSNVYSYNRRGPSGSLETMHKDTTLYHVWVMENYTIDEFKGWNKNSKLASELVDDYVTYGDSVMGDGSSVENYINNLSDNDKAVLYATMLFTRVYERPNTNNPSYCGTNHNWISARCVKAIGYYHKVVGFEGEVVPYYQGYYQNNFDNVDKGACVSSTFAMACASVGIKGQSGYLYNVSDTYAPYSGTHPSIYPNAYNNSLFYWVNGKNLLKHHGAIELGKDEENDTSIKGIKFRFFNEDMTKEYLEAELLAGHYVFLRVGTTQTQYASNNHTVLAIGIEDGKIIIADPGFPDTNPSSWDKNMLEDIKSKSITDSSGNPMYSPCRRIVANDWAFGNLEGYSNYYYNNGERVTGTTYSTFIIWKD